MHPGEAAHTSIRPPHDAQRALIVGLLTALGYLVGVWIGLQLTLVSAPISTLWPPNAILLAALLLTPPRRWWIPIVAVLPVHFLAELTLGVPFAMASCWYVSNTFEAVLGATIVSHCLGRPPRFEHVREVTVFMIAAGLVGPAVSSFLDVSFVAWVGWRYSDFWYLWRTRTLSNAVATLTIVPLLVTVFLTGWRQLRSPHPAEILEMAGLLGGLCVTCAIVFTHPHHHQLSVAWLSAPMPFLLWAALRRGIASVSLCMMLTGVFMVEGVINGRGPFVGYTPEGSARAVQIYLLIACPSMMLLSATLKELRAAKATAERQTESLNFALEAANMRMWEWDTMNRLLIKAKGHARVQNLYDFLERVHPDDREVLATAMTTFSEPGRSSELEFRIRGREGYVRWISSRGKMLRDSNGRPHRVIGVCSDASRRKAQELQLNAQREQIARLNKVALLGALSAALAHELKQPLAAILSNAQAARRALRAREPKLQEVQDILADIVSEDRRTAALLERLRSIFTRDAARAGAMAVNSAVRDVLLLEQAALQSRGVTTHLDLADDLPLAAIERVELQQVLINLVVNACDALQENSEGNRRVSIQTHAHEGGVAIEVRDNGSGLADPESIFGAFFTTKPEGLGLGLSISRTIVTARGGKLTARNNAMGGATFRVWLPAAPAHGRGPAHALDPVPDTHDDTLSTEEEEEFLPVAEHLLSRIALQPSAARTAVGPKDNSSGANDGRIVSPRPSALRDDRPC